MAFLDNTGVTRLLNDIKSKFTAPKSIAYVESTTAKTNHAVGSHFMLGEQLKRATSAIATGETIGTSNSADDTVQGQIDTLQDSVNNALDLEHVKILSVAAGDAGNGFLVEADQQASVAGLYMDTDDRFYHIGKVSTFSTFTITKIAGPDFHAYSLDNNQLFLNTGPSVRALFVLCSNLSSTVSVRAY